MLKFRASMIGKLMAYPDKDTLSQGAMTAIYEKASQIILDWQPQLDMYVIEKGRQCEDMAIELLSSVLGKKYVKNATRLSTDLITGEWDIFDEEENKIIDIKNAYSKKTFPIIITEGDMKLYEWQLTAYMSLKDADKAAIAYCLVDTPSDLVSSRDDPDWHYVSHLPAKDRVTIFNMERCATKERQMLKKVKLAQDELKRILEERDFDLSLYEVDF